MYPSWQWHWSVLLHNPLLGLVQLLTLLHVAVTLVRVIVWENKEIVCYCTFISSLTASKQNTILSHFFPRELIITKKVSHYPWEATEHKAYATDHTVFVVNYCWHETNQFLEGYEWSSENCISKLHLGLNISMKLNILLINSLVVFFSPS